uniref:Uncharacterized protein n=1 Tax=Glossina austeni TaxID=7395 RepID=A0A1A9UT30_GLOAU
MLQLCHLYEQMKRLIMSASMRTTMSTMSTMSTRIHRKGLRIPSKRHPGKAFPGKLHSVSRVGPGKLVPGKRFPPRPHPPPCDNSNDSGFGFDQHSLSRFAEIY